MAQYIDAMVNEAFGSHPYAYSFSTDGKSLLMQEALPQPKGTNELAGKMYNGTTWDSDQQKSVKDPNEEYVFGANKAYTLKFSGTVYETGSYSYDSAQKQVYFSRATVDGQTAAEYYETVTIWGDNRFINDDAYKAAQTNDQFSRHSNMYDPTQRLIGWFD